MNPKDHLLLLHGAIGAADQLQPLAAELEKDFTVHALDFSGHGGKPFPGGPYSIVLFAEEVLAYIDSLGVDRVAIFGYSMGGYVGMWLALHHPARVYRLVTLAAKFHWDPEIARRETQMINPQKILEKVPAFAKALEQRHQPNSWEMVLERTAALLADLGANPPLSPEACRAVTVPALLLLGGSDKMVSLEETQAMADSIPGARMEILPGTPHPIEQVDTVALAGCLRRFYR